MSEAEARAARPSSCSSATCGDETAPATPYPSLAAAADAPPPTRDSDCSPPTSNSCASIGCPEAGCCSLGLCGNDCFEDIEEAAEESPGTCDMACVQATWLPSLLLTALVMVPLLPLLANAVISDQYRPPSPAITDVTHDRCSSVYCSIEMCLPLDPCDDGEVHQNATECGCCPLCIKYLDKGRACGPHGVLRFPALPTTMCRPPLKCIKGYCAEGPLRRGGVRPAEQLLDDQLSKQ